MIAAAAACAAVVVIAWQVAPRPQPRGRVARRPTRVGPMIAWLTTAVSVAAALGVFAAAIVAVATALARRVSHLRRAAMRRRTVERAYPDALEMLVLAIRAGELPAAAMQSIQPFLPTPIAPAFALVQQRVDAGERFADALGVLGEHIGQQAQPLVDSLAAADRYGLPLAPVLDRLAFEARQQRRRAADARARQLAVRLSLPLVLCTLPSFVLLAIVPLLLGAISSLSL